MSRFHDNLLLANVSRRGLLKGLVTGSALMLAARWDLSWASEQAQFGAGAMPGGWVDDPNVFIHINTDGIVTFINNRAEMGQGIRTSLAMVAADELGADWEQVRARQANADQDKYGNQNTDGSRSMRHWYDPIRRAAAAARMMLEQAAANQWKVAVHEVQAEVHKVVHPASGRELSFGDLANAARELEVPNREALVLKSNSELRFIGKESGLINGEVKSAHPKAIDGEDIVTGKAVFGADVDLEGTLYAVIARPPVYGAKVKSVDDSDALSVTGVNRVLSIEGTDQPGAFNPLGGVAVVASNTWAAMEGRRALKIQWDLEAAGDNAGYTSNAYRKALEEAAQSPGKVIRQSGDVDKALEEAATRVSATYYMPHMAQAAMEPPVAVVRITGGKAEAWAIQSFAHEMAVAAGKDHRDYVLDLLGPDRQVHNLTVGDGWNYGEDPDLHPIDIARMRRVIERATDEAGWGRETSSRRGGLGLAFHHSFVSYTAVVFDAEVSDEGEVTIHRADIAFDCGPQANPERIRSQMEGSVVMGIGVALQSEVTFKDGVAQQSNFDSYLIPRMPNAPKVLRVHLIDNPNDAMGGVGEPGFPPVAPALCNAIYAATGKRIRRLPVGNQLS